jgi:Fe-S-cluster containining protein
MEIKKKLLILDRIYKVYDEILSRARLACRKHCSVCCTVNVALTSLEGARMIDYLNETGKSHLLDRLAVVSGRRRFVPRVTINELAALCIRGEEIPEEEIDPGWGVCPFLTNDECPVYPVRPFGCRGMVSEVRCRQGGSARVDPFILTVNDVFMQYIENVDAEGGTGNLTDMLQFLSSGERWKRGLKKDRLVNTGLISNRPIPALMIPPEYREKLLPIQKAIVACAGE